MDGLRTRLEANLVRRATQLVRELSDERAEHLTELLGELEERGAEVTSAETRLERIEHRAHAIGVEGDGAEQVERLVAELERRAQELADLRATADELRARVTRLEAEAIDVEQRAGALADRERTLAAIEEKLEERIRSLKRGDGTFDSRAVRAAAEAELRLDELLLRERRLAEREERLARKEADVAAYVAQVQAGLARA